MWEFDHKEGFMTHKEGSKNWYFWTVVLKKTLESPLDSNEIKSVNPKGNQPWIFIGSTDIEALIPWLPDAQSWLIRKDPDAGKDWQQEEKGTAEDEMIGWHHWLNGHGIRVTLGVGDGDGQGSLVCFIPWVAKSWTRLSNWTELIGEDSSESLGLHGDPTSQS